MTSQKQDLKNQIQQLQRSSEAAWKRFDYAQSEEYLRQAQALAPSDPRILLTLGFHHGLRYDYEKATDCFDKAIHLAGGRIAAHVAAGWHCLNFSQPALARSYFERALKKNPDEVETLCPLAGICEREGLLDDAEALATRAARLAPNSKAARLVQAKVLRRRQRLEEAEKVLRRVVGQHDPNPWIAAQIGYELGINLDGQARYDDAMAAFLDAKKILRPSTEENYATHQAKQQYFLAEAHKATREKLKAFCDDAVSLQPSHSLAFLVGHPRSGTTLMEQVLDSHNAVISLEETKIFDTEIYSPLTLDDPKRQEIACLEKLPLEQISQLRENYFTKAALLLHEPIGNRLFMDKNPMLITRMLVITRIFPEAKFIVALRDPRDVCISSFMQAMVPATANLAWLDLGRTVEQYAAIMTFWLTLRNKITAPWMEVRYENLLTNLESTARCVLEGLGLDWDPGVLNYNKNATKKIIRSPTYADVTKPVYTTSQGRWRNYHKFLEPHLARLEPFIKAFGYQ